VQDARDWIAWHDEYDDPGNSLRQRLEIVTSHIVEALNTVDRSPLRVISMCAGQARDLRGALARVERRDLVGRLVELDPTLAADARRGLSDLGAKGLEVVVGDAGLLDAYEGAAPADLVLECGVFGNVSDAGVERTLRASSALCAPAATLIWTRHRRPPDLTISMRRWLEETGFENTAFDTIDDPTRLGAVGVARFVGNPVPLGRGRLFTFGS
jgi:hypothetical protein